MNEFIIRKMKDMGNFYPGVSKLPEEVNIGDLVCTVFVQHEPLGVIIDKWQEENWQSQFERDRALNYMIELCSVLRMNGMIIVSMRASYLQHYKETKNE
jgi:hypothetical protein